MSANDTGDRKTRAQEVISRLAARYPEAECSLVEREPWRLLIATRLSAQCTDARVNTVTPVLFSRYPTLGSLADADVGDVESIIKSCGFYHGKARDIIGACAMIRDRFGGEVPDTMEQLLELPGVGRKTANLILGDVYGKPAIVADTHCIRISNRLGLCDSRDPAKVETQLREIVPPADGNMLCHRFVLFGRDVCTARSPMCGECELSGLCANKLAPDAYTETSKPNN